MNKKNLPIGRENFKEILNNNLYYVDKTEVIEELLCKQNKLSLFPRPRRFGKTLFLSMLDNFFNIEYKRENKKLFKDLYISKSSYYKELSNYPVISISFKELKGNNFNYVYDMYKEIIRELYAKKYYLRDKLHKYERELFDKYLYKTATNAEYGLALKTLSSMLKNYYKTEVIILIDEYDVPMQNGYINGFYNDILSLIKVIFSSALKTNDNLKFCILTGVLKVSKESLFSDLNNIKVYSVIDEGFNEYFGFTEKETNELLDYYDLKLDNKVKKMYDGYNFSGVSIYNPWSILNYANDKRLVAYWVNTSGNELIENMVRKSRNDVKIVIEKLLLGKEIKFRYNDKITYMDLKANNNPDTVMNFLLFSGYLTLTNDTKIEDTIKKVILPNNEVRNMFLSMVEKLTYDNFSIELGEEFRDSFIKNDKIRIEEILNKMMKSMSFYDAKENFYHGYMLGLFSYFMMDDKYIIKSNRESGMGRFDMSIESIDRKLGIIIEFKIAINEDAEEVAKKANKQIEEKEYYQELILHKIDNIYKYVIVFYDGKKCIVR